MARTARCPACGAPVEFKSVASILAVCDYCQSTLIRSGEELENLGKMAALLEDQSPVQRGAEGRWQGQHFGVIGRIQLRYDAGLWNEWHLLFDDGKSGWLSEAGGEYVISLPKWSAETLPRFEELKVGGRQLLDGRPFTVTNILTAECIAGEGELPFKVGAGYPAPVADLRDETGRFATLDYSDDAAKPLLFLGAAVDFRELAWANLRQDIPLPEVTVAARRFDCPACGAPLTVSHENIVSVGCGSCGAVIDAGDERLKILAKAAERLQVRPLLPLGAEGRLRGEAVEVIGFMHRHMVAEGSRYYWSEYLLAGPEGKLIWLTEYDGHWNIAWTLSRSALAVVGNVRYGDQEFKHFQGYQAFVDYVIGEFPWRVRLGEMVKVEDYVAPPRLLCRETTVDEETWTLAEYLSPDELREAFKLKTALAAPRGIFANQPNPFADSHGQVHRRFWRFLGLGLAIHFLLLFFGPHGRLVDQNLIHGPNDDEPKLGAEFRLTGAKNRIELEHDTTVDNNWVAFNTTLVNKDSGENWQVAREIGHYSGVDGGESWSEGSRSDEVVFADLPPGNYVLAVESDMDANARPVGDRLRVAKAGPRWSSLFLLIGFLAIFPLYTFVRHRSFEVKRWADSDHPIVTESGGDDD